ncbi:MAG: C40 family peptidase [Burkholderiales bacterium]
MTPREAIVEAARSWIGTPFHHQGRRKGIGADCAGIVLGVAREMGYSHCDRVGYSREPHGLFHLEVARQLVALPLSGIEPGDLLTFAFDRYPQHIGIVTNLEPLCVVHAYAQVRGCIEQALDPQWISRVRGAWRFPELAP